MTNDEYAELFPNPLCKEDNRLIEVEASSHVIKIPQALYIVTQSILRIKRHLWIACDLFSSSQELMDNWYMDEMSAWQHPSAVSVFPKAALIKEDERIESMMNALLELGKRISYSDVMFLGDNDGPSNGVVAFIIGFEALAFNGINTVKAREIIEAKDALNSKQ